ncbi:MAG: sulfite exporter TauE/SafE family protein [Candidatus Thorarchaeota archaeon]|nr:MAG: sulfite exporter TauE/SafE family protein [Candidatus Thorarchaeota archaeon]
MQEMIMEATIIAIFAIGVGTISSMVGIGGGIFNTPLLMIVFLLNEQFAPATALVAALFLAVASSIAYWRQNPRPIIPKVGLFLAIATVPGSLIGVILRTMIESPYALRLIFGVLLMPVAIKMLFAIRRKKGDITSELARYDMSNLTDKRLIISLVGGFIGGVSAGLLGIGGGAVIVPVLSVLMGLPMHAAVATSMFTMMFTASAGTAMNFANGFINPYYAVSLGVGMLLGAQIGSRLASRVDSVQLKQVFGLILVFPLVKMMKLGQMWLDPLDVSILMSTIGDILIWLVIVIPIGLLRFYQLRKQKTSSLSNNELQNEVDT